MKVSFDNPLSKKNNLSTSVAKHTTSGVKNNHTTQRKNFDEILIRTSSNSAKIDTTIKEIIVEAKTPKNQDTLDILKSQIENGSYLIDINKLAKHTMLNW